MSSRLRRRWYWLGFALSVVATAYCFLGVVMNAGFAVSTSGAQADGHRLAANIFAALMLVGLGLGLCCVVMLWRTRISRRAIS
jgi:hypothetical protein